MWNSDLNRFIETKIHFWKVCAFGYMVGYTYSMSGETTNLKCIPFWVKNGDIKARRLTKLLIKKYGN